MNIFKRILESKKIDDLKEGQAQLGQQLSTIIAELKRGEAHRETLLASNHELIEKTITVLSGIDSRLDELEKKVSQEQKIEFVKGLLPVLDSLSLTISSMGRRLTSLKDEPSPEMVYSRSIPKARLLKNSTLLPNRSGRPKRRQASKLNKHPFRKHRHLLAGINRKFLNESKKERIEEELNSWLSGIQMVWGKALKAMTKFNVRRIPTEGKLFNPHLHKAVGIEEGSDVEDNKILKEELSGYILNDRIIRYAEVVVGRRVVEEEVKEEVEEPQAKAVDKRATWPPPRRF